MCSSRSTGFADVFTGIIEEVGVIRSVEPLEGGRRIRVAASRVTEGLRPGDSVAVEGACLTAVRPESDGFTVEAIGTTLSRTTLGALERGRRVNLERALALGERLGGHLVQGHVDGVGEVLRVDRKGEHVLVDLRLPEDVAEVTVLHGSIAVNGASMTVNALPAPGVAQVAVIPYTWENTTFSDLRTGSPVNLEGDMLGRFVVHWLNRRET